MATQEQLTEAEVSAAAVDHGPFIGLRDATGRSIRAELPADLAAVSATRRKLRDQLAQWGLGPGPETDGILLAAHELLANAVVHGCTTGRQESVTMTVCWTADELRIEVTDPSTQQPQTGDAPGDAESGRGLHLVDAFADRWGITPAADGIGKQVWLTMDLHRDGGSW